MLHSSRQGSFRHGCVAYTSLPSRGHIVDKDGDLEMDDSSNEVCTIPTAVQPCAQAALHLLSLPNEIILHIMEQCTPISLLNFVQSCTHFSDLLRANLTLHVESMLNLEQARLVATMRPLDFHGLPLSTAIRLYFNHHGKPLPSRYWPAASDFALQFVEANYDTTLPEYDYHAEYTFYAWTTEFVLWADHFRERDNRPEHEDNTEVDDQTSETGTFIASGAAACAISGWDIDVAQGFVDYVQGPEGMGKEVPDFDIERDILSFRDQPVITEVPLRETNKTRTAMFWHNVGLGLDSGTEGPSLAHDNAFHYRMGLPKLEEGWYFALKNFAGKEDCKDGSWFEDLPAMALARTLGQKLQCEDRFWEVTWLNLRRAALMSEMEVCFGSKDKFRWY